MARLTSPSGSVVTVPDGKVDGLLARGFTRAEKAPAKATKRTTKSAKKATK